MSLQEFFSDESYGGSWADDEIDIASISVPIEKNKGYNYGSGSSYGSGGSRFASGGGFGRSTFLDNGPPYIVKLSNIPITSNDAFINDLFHSRFTPLVKFKILFDPFSQPLESGIVKKIAFVELPSFESQNKVAKWQDVVYKGSRRVTIEAADFNDFQQSMKFNQEHHQELLRVEQTFLSRPRPGFGDDVGPGRGRPSGRAPGGMPLDNISLPGAQHRFGPQLRKLSNSEPHRPSVFTERSTSNEPTVKAPLKPKPNPFGNAKPVDVLAHEHEIEKNLITVKHTVVRAPWAGGETPTGANGAHGHAATIQVPSGPKKSLADILGSSRARDHTKNPRASSANSTPKPARKPTILMKKPSVPSPEPQLKAQADYTETAIGGATTNTSDTVKETPAGQDAVVDPIEAKLSQASLGPAKDEVPSADTTNNENSGETKIESRVGTSPDEDARTRTGSSLKEDRRTRPGSERSSNDNAKKNEGRKSEGRSRPAKELDPSNAPRQDFPDRRQRRSSNKSTDRPPRTNAHVRAPRNEKNADGTNQEETTGTCRANREPRARRPNRRGSVEKTTENTAESTLRHSSQSDVGSHKKKVGDPSQVDNSKRPISTTEESTPGLDSERSGEHPSRGRGRRGRGRGDSGTGRGGHGGRGRDRRDKAEGSRDKPSGVGRGENHKTLQTNGNTQP